MNPVLSFLDFFWQMFCAFVAGVPLGLLSSQGWVFKLLLAVAAVLCIDFLVLCIKKIKEGKRGLAHTLFFLFFVFWLGISTVGYIYYVASELIHPLSFFLYFAGVIFFLGIGFIFNFVLFIEKVFSLLFWFSELKEPIEYLLSVSFSVFSIVLFCTAIWLVKKNRVLLSYVFFSCAVIIWICCGLKGLNLLA